MHRKAFTLIELLVVIAIIAILASIVVASLNSAREKGRLAGGLQFEANVYHAEGDQAVGLWDFNECTGTTVADSTGLGNSGSLTGSQSWQSNSPSGTGCSFNFNGSSYMTVTNNSSIDFGSSQDFTISVWVKTTQGTALSLWPRILSKEDGFGTRQGYNMVLHGSNVSAMWYFEIFVSGTNYDVLGTSNIADGKWHNIVGVRSGSTIYAYQDGMLSSAVAAVPGSVQKNIPLTFGRASANNVDYFSGQIDNVRIYAKSLTASDIGKLYASEAPRFRLADK